MRTLAILGICRKMDRIARKQDGYNSTMPQRQPPNPFYVAALPVGVIFLITACSYMVMAYRGLNPHHAQEVGLIGLMDKHGLVILVGELLLLGVLTALAISTDGYWTRRFAGRLENSKEQP